MADPPADAPHPDDLDPGAGLGRAAEPGLAGVDLGSLLAGAQELVAAQARAAEQELTGTSGGGAVEVRVTGGGQFRKVTIRPDVVDPDDVGLLEDLVLAALHDAMAKVQDAQSGALGGLGGLDLGGLGGLLGGQP